MLEAVQACSQADSSTAGSYTGMATLILPEASTGSLASSGSSGTTKLRLRWIAATKLPAHGVLLCSVEIFVVVSWS